jgi:thiamine-phosphate pyrophosphorylase
MTDQPQIYLITPPAIDLDTFGPQLAACLDTVPVACLRLSLVTRDPDLILRAGDLCRETAHQRDVAVIIDSHLAMVERLGLDGVHLPDGARSVSAARKALGPDAIIGAFCGDSRHDGMNAGEIGADYVSFGPLSDPLGSARLAPRDLFQWWSEMIEVPVVAEGGLTPDLVVALAPHSDFLAFGPEIWAAPDPAPALQRLTAALR